MQRRNRYRRKKNVAGGLRDLHQSDGHYFSGEGRQDREAQDSVERRGWTLVKQQLGL
jgi:hypothetical protein